MPKTTGDFIRLGRFKKGLTQRELAAKLMISRIEVIAWEKDKEAPNLEQWEALAALLGVPVAMVGQANPTREAVLGI